MHTKNLPSDQILTTTYLAVGIPSDRIALDPQSLAAYLSALPKAYQSSDGQAIAARVIYLRKKGHLPRLRRPR